MNFESKVSRTPAGHIYYNASLTNASTQPLEVRYIDTRSEPMMNKPDDFEMGIVRFDVSGQTIPITIVNVVQPSNVSIPQNLATDLYATLTYLGIDYTSNVILTPSGSFVYPQLLGGVYKFQKLLDDINTAYAASYAAIPGPPANSAPPQFIWNPITELLDVYVDPSFIGSTPSIQLWANFALSEYLGSFNFFFNGYNLANRKDVRYEFRNTTVLLQPAVGSRQGLPQSVQSAPATLYLMQQEAKWDPNWNQSRALVMTTGLLPIRSEFIPTNVSVNNNSISQATQSIVTDFLLPADTNVLSSRNVIQYLPTAEYRMIDLISDTPFYTIDLQMSWQDYKSNIYPLILNPGSSFSVKILFRKKGITD